MTFYGILVVLEFVVESLFDGSTELRCRIRQAPNTESSFVVKVLRCTDELVVL